MHRNQFIGSLSMLGIGFALYGCSADVGEPAAGNEPSAPATASSAATVSRTVVRLTRDSAPTLTTSIISLAEQQQEIARRTARIAARSAAVGPAIVPGEVTAQDVVVDTDCSNPDSIWLFNASFLSGDEICFYQDGNTNTILG